MSLTEIMKQLSHLMSSMGKDLSKAERGNKSAAQRVRANSVRFEKVGKQYRKESLSEERGEKPKKRGVKKAKRRSKRFFAK